MEWNRVWAIGRDNYLRLYPNLGVGFRLGQRRIALSYQGGLEVYRAHPRLVWQRVYAKWSKVKRPGGKV